MSDDGQVSLESSCERELSDVERLLPSRNQLIKGKESSYAVARKISQGRYGAVFEVLRQNDGRRFAAKLEVCETHSHGLHLDYTVLCQAMKANAVHFPRFIDRGKIEGHFRFVVMTMYGDNISEIRNAFVEAHFSLSTALRIGIAALEALEELHNLGYVHRDVKGSNFITNYSLRDSHANRSGNVKVYLIDFGLCRKISDLPNGVENGVSTSHFRGTTRYASLSAHNGLEQSPRDDLESWFYMLIEMITGELPWAHLHKAEREEVKKMKEDARTRDGLHRLLKGCPKVEFRRILNYIDSLTCSSQPDDKFIKQLLQLAMKNYGCKMDEPLDWED